MRTERAPSTKPSTAALLLGTSSMCATVFLSFTWWPCSDQWRLRKDRLQPFWERSLHFKENSEKKIANILALDITISSFNTRNCEKHFCNYEGNWFDKKVIRTANLGFSNLSDMSKTLECVTCVFWRLWEKQCFFCLRQMNLYFLLPTAEGILT